MFRTQLTRHPIAFDPQAARDLLARVEVPSDVRPLVEGVAGCSPYLARLMQREASFLDTVWDQSADAAFAALLAEVEGIEGDPKVALRQAKRRAALLVGLAEIGGVWPVMTAAEAWTRFADAALHKCLTYSVARIAPHLPGVCGGLVAMAMGKMGAFELNYSSDIDLVLLFDETLYDPGDYGEVRVKLLRAARLAMAQMSDITSDGYVFRTDLRLRPDPGSTPIVMSMEAAERYFEAMGRTWERAAWIKARPAAGDLDAGARFLERLRPFIWRRHLDYAVVQEAHDMRLRIRDHKGLTQAWTIAGHDLKLGHGGIREIEFFTQTHQIISGGRDPSLRVRGTLDGLDRLVDAGWVRLDVAAELGTQYRYLREVEHRLQMVQDAQTHRMPKDDEGLRRIACFMGAADCEGFLADLTTRMRGVEGITDPSFRPGEAAPEPDPIEGAEAVTARWDTYPALRSSRARDIFRRLRPAILTALARAARPEEALAAFDDFLRGLPAGVQILSLFEANPVLVDLTADICAIAPDLARYLSGNAGVFDGVIGGAFLAPLPDRYDPAPHDPTDYEGALTRLRLWHREAHFRIGVHLLRGLADPSEAGAAYARLAEATLKACWDVAEAETARRYGRVPGLRLAGLGMGSLGAGRLTARSDLDLVVLHDGAAKDAVSDGRRGLGAAQWAAKFTQVLITALNAQTGDGRLYEVDMRLRPSGRQGPVATALSGFRSYQATEAWVWEHMALTRARAVVGDAQTCVAAEAARNAVLDAGRFDAATVLSDLAAMRHRLEGAGRTGQGLSVKSGAGRMQDIELAAQAQAMLACTGVRATSAQLACDGWLTEVERAILIESYRRLSDAQQVLRLLTPKDPPEDLGTGGDAFLATTLGVSDAADVVRLCDAAATAAAEVIDGALARAGAAD
ncbi:glutamine-synthetase adenylyltransferase [Jannaschia sp. M317]|uniref:[protein-PII] uridylyltransferase family protein n=1 Tax=Jannaschia sp. M317 TaxID=2867011 RepID=UPI0021A4CEE4|nr:glutamine-synthetase adenylyltransferase [Jannaschia sp. M317]UWQ16540.1 glutamine-synthetase adenylyltransferase [Jannaschia sp. M317]